MLKLREHFRSYTQVIIGDGRQTLLFYDKWLTQGPISQTIGEESRNWGEGLKVRQWWEEGLGWKIPNSFERRFPDIARRIKQIQLTEEEDIVFWELTANGNYAISSYYEQFRTSFEKVNLVSIVIQRVGIQN